MDFAGTLALAEEVTHELAGAVELQELFLLLDEDRAVGSNLDAGGIFKEERPALVGDPQGLLELHDPIGVRSGGTGGILDDRLPVRRDGRKKNRDR
ncbi:MAG: hypothetical protein PHI34_06955 [Acidobacteriota bacterium]|nr:hypothetical protein [Acidobacteriota bacterium]